MIRMTWSTLAVLCAGPAFAHPASTGHVHAEGGWPVLIACAVILLAGGVFAWQKRRAEGHSA
ncbi:hypothetical protein [Palleronia abyssalis]|uniref:hypothetical protein n=1 Tax=Palleronia abyssalis TaxID=1501240 RepID=UPI000D554D82|nr:hypothetical protein [Palleronia abyssalis]